MAKNKKAKYSNLNAGKANNSSPRVEVEKSDGKRYKFESSVKVPNIDEILEAASDFDSFGVSDLVINRKHEVVVSEDGKLKAVPRGVEEIQALGDQVAEEAEREQEESKRKMREIMGKAVSTPQSVEALREVASSTVTGDRKKILEQEMNERQQIEDAKNAVIEAREERRRMQKRAVVDLLIKKDSKEETNLLHDEDTAENVDNEAEVNNASIADADIGNAVVEASETDVEMSDDDFFASLYGEDDNLASEVTEETSEDVEVNEEFKQEIIPEDIGIGSFDDFL